MSKFIPPVAATARGITIAGIDQPTVLHYFSCFNAGDFQAVSRLFAVDGALQPPFDEPVIGQAAIAAYLDREASGFLLHPQTGQYNQQDYSCSEFRILGSVQTPWFSVNVCWTLLLNPQTKIRLATIKLLASMQELLPLRQTAQKPDGL